MNIEEYIEQAIIDGKSITISYIKYGGEVSTRKISNIRYSEEYGHGYISAFCHLRGEDRTFKISRIKEVDGIISNRSHPQTTMDIFSVRQVTLPTTHRQISSVSQTSTKISVSAETLVQNSHASIISSTEKRKPQPTTPSQDKKEGCYIATMAYGNYEHPNVLVLRQYRDIVLLKSFLGQLFVKVYYSISPYMVIYLRQHHKINKVIRFVLDKIVCKISKKLNIDSNKNDTK